MKFIQDPKTHQESITVTFALVSFILSILSLITSHIWAQCLPASILSILLFALCMLFYRLRKIDSFKVDVKEGSVEVKD